jgi:hypothetical protein
VSIFDIREAWYCQSGYGSAVGKLRGMWLFTKGRQESIRPTPLASQLGQGHRRLGAGHRRETPVPW